MEFFTSSWPKERPSIPRGENRELPHEWCNALHIIPVHYSPLGRRLSRSNSYRVDLSFDLEPWGSPTIAPYFEEFSPQIHPHAYCGRDSRLPGTLTAPEPDLANAFPPEPCPPGTHGATERGQIRRSRNVLSGGEVPNYARHTKSPIALWVA
jgi:hypothetical protein